MSENTTRKGIELILSGSARYLILSTAYKNWRDEANLKKEMAIKMGVKTETIRVIPEVTSTYDEARMIKDVLDATGSKSFILVADRWHMPRALRAFRAMLPSIPIFSVSVSCPKYEMAKEPLLIKSIRAGFAPLWISWNILFYLRDLLFLKKTKK